MNFSAKSLLIILSLLSSTLTPLSDQNVYSKYKNEMDVSIKTPFTETEENDYNEEDQTIDTGEIIIDSENDVSEETEIIIETEEMKNLENEEIIIEEDETLPAVEYSEEETEEEKCLQKYVFIEQSAIDGIGSLPEEVMELLPEENYVKADEEIILPELKSYEVNGYQFSGWELYTELLTGERTFQGVWRKINPDKRLKSIQLRSSSTLYSGFGSTWTYQRPGYIGTHAFLLGGEPAYCIDPSKKVPAAGTLYTYNAKITSRVAEIIGMGQINGISHGAIQATLDRYAGYNASSSSNEPTDPNDPVYNASGYSCSLDAYDPADSGAQRFGINASCTKETPTPEDGWIRVNKVAAERVVDYLNLYPERYSLENAIYGYYTDKECKNLFFEAATKPNGQTSRNRVPQGTYYIKEISASKGFKIDQNVYEVTVTAALVYEVYSIEEPEELQGKISLLKKPASNSIDYFSNNTNYSLAGAEYTVYSDKDLKNSVGKLTTDDSGKSNELSVNEGTYYVKETKASKGFKLDKEVYKVNVKANKTATFTSIEDPNMAKVKIKKKEGLVNYEFSKLFPNNYSLANARYGLYSDSKLTKKINELKTDNDGNTTAIELPLGTYYIKEIEASKGYMLDEQTYKVSLLEADKTYTVESVEMPYYQLFDLVLIKENARDKSDTDYLEDAQFILKYYDTEKSDLTGLKAKYSWIFSPKLNSKKEAEVIFDHNHYISGDKLLTDKANKFFLPLGKFTLEESKAPKTFTRDENVYLGSVGFESNARVLAPSIKIDGLNSLIIEGKTIRQEEEKQSIRINITKLDSETKTNKPQGVASLEGAEFELTYFDENNNKKVLIGKITTDKDGKGSIDKDLQGKSLLPGTYYIKEIKAPPGYILNNNEYKIEAAIKDDTSAIFEYSIDIENDISNIIVHKVDSNGDYLKDEETVLQILDEENNVIYSWKSDGMPHLIKGLSTIKRYLLHEFSTSPGYRLAGDKVIEASESETRNYTMINKKINIKTSASFEGKTKNHVADGIAKITDEVSYENLQEGKNYILKGQLIDKKDETVLMEVSHPFTPKTSFGYEYLQFEFNLDDYDNHDFVVYETLYDENEKEIVRHADINDNNQTVHIDPIKRVDVIIRKANQDDELLSDAIFKLSLKHIRKDGSVELTDFGEIKTNDGLIKLEKIKENSVLSIKEVKAPDGYYLEKEEKALEIPGDIEQETIEYTFVNYKPEIKTNANFKESKSKNYVADGIAHIVDTVSYKYLEEEREYLLKAELINKKDKESILSTEKKFKPEKNSGEIKVEFELELDNYPDTDLVVFEELYLLEDKNQIFVTEHKDIDDKNQTVHINKLYDATVVLYKTNTDHSIKLNGAIFDVSAKRTKKDGKIEERQLGKYLTGGIYFEDEKEFVLELSKDADMKNILDSYESKIHKVFETNYVAINGLEDGTYYVRKKGEKDIKRYDVAKGAIILLDQKEDTLLTFIELISPNGYQINKEPFVINVGHDYSISLIENYRSNRRVVIPKTGD